MGLFKDKRLTKRRLDALDASMRPNGHTTPLVDLEEPQTIWVWLRNDSGNDRERYECMSLDDPIFGLDLDGSVDLMFKAIASDPAKTPVILIEPIANGEMGRGIIHGLALAKVGSGAVTATNATPGTNQLTPGSGSIKLLAKPDAAVDTLLPVLLGAGASGGTGIAKSPAGGIAARSGDVVGVATCTLAELYDDAGVVKIREKSPAESVLIYNTTAVNVSGAKWIHWKMDGGYLLVDVADCG